MGKELARKLKKIRLLGLDFDGTLTNGYVYVDHNGVESVRCSRKDSLGLAMLQENGIEVCVISKETNRVVSARCKKMNIPCHTGVHSGEKKREVLERIATEKKLLREEVAFMGDDINDIPALMFAGVALTVFDGHTQVKNLAHYITTAKGGDHAVREICELILRAKGIKI